MADEIILALISGGAIGSIFTFIIAIRGLKFDYNKLFAETISGSRNEWLNQFRNEITKFLTLNEILMENMNKEYKETEEYRLNIKEWHNCKNIILIRLNMSEETHQKLYTLINTISFNIVNPRKYIILKEVLMDTTRKLIKIEWERVKEEARGNKK